MAILWSMGLAHTRMLVLASAHVSMELATGANGLPCGLCTSQAAPVCRYVGFSQRCRQGQEMTAD